MSNGKSINSSIIFSYIQQYNPGILEVFKEINSGSLAVIQKAMKEVFAEQTKSYMETQRALDGIIADTSKPNVTHINITINVEENETDINENDSE